MKLIRVKLRCKKAGLEKLVKIPRHESKGVPLDLGYIPPKGTTITLEGFNTTEWNGQYKVINVEGDLKVGPAKHKDEAEVRYIEDYIVDLKKIS